MKPAARVVAIPSQLRAVLASVVPDVAQVQIELSASAESETGELRDALRETARQLDEVEQAIANLLVSQDELDRGQKP